MLVEFVPRHVEWPLTLLLTPALCALCLEGEWGETWPLQFAFPKLLCLKTSCWVQPVWDWWEIGGRREKPEYLLLPCWVGQHFLSSTDLPPVASVGFIESHSLSPWWMGEWYLQSLGLTTPFSGDLTAPLYLGNNCLHCSLVKYLEWFLYWSDAGKYVAFVHSATVCLLQMKPFLTWFWFSNL